MIRQNIWHLFRLVSSEAAIGGKAEIADKFSYDREPRRKARHTVYHAEIDTGAFRVELRQRRVECVVRPIERRDMYPVDAPSCGLHRAVGQFDGASKIRWRKSWPAAKCPETEMKTQRHAVRESRATGGQPAQHASRFHVLPDSLRARRTRRRFPMPCPIESQDRRAEWRRG